MFFSIIIPVYNVEKYLEDCLLSVCNQTFPDYEIICINDCSSDNSSEILNDFLKRSNRIKVLNNKQNLGLSYSRNVGIQNAKGNYILFVDSDDFIENNTLEILHGIIMQYPYINFDFINFQKNRLFEAKYSTKKENFPNKNYKTTMTLQNAREWFIEAVNSGDLVIGSWSRLYRKEFLLENKLFFYEKMLYEDQLFLLQCVCKANNTISIPNRLYTYRMRERSIMTSMNSIELDSRIIMLAETLALWKNVKTDKKLDDAIKKYIQENIFDRLIYLLKIFGKKKELEIGDAADNMLFALLVKLCESRMQNRKIRLYYDEINLIKQYSKIIIYGAGKIALQLVEELRIYGIEPDYFAVTQKDDLEEIAGIYIKQIDELISWNEEALVVIAVKNSQQEILETLKRYNYKNIMRLQCD